MNPELLNFLNNLIQDPYFAALQYLNDPFSNQGLQRTLQMGNRSAMLRDEDVARILEMSRDFNPRLQGIAPRQAPSIFEPMLAPTRTTVGTISPSQGLAGFINPAGIPSGMPVRSGDTRPTVGRAEQDRMQLNPIGGMFPSTLKDYYIPVFGGTQLGRNEVRRG